MKKKRKPASKSRPLRVPKQTLRDRLVHAGGFVGTVVGQAVARILADLPKDVANSIAGLPRDFNPNPEPSDPLREVAEEKLREEED